MRRSYSSCPVTSRKFRNSSADSRTSVSSSRSSNWRRKAPAATGVVSVQSAGLHQVVLDAEASGGPVSADDAGGDADEPGVADQPDDLALTVGLGHQAGDLLVPAELVWSPPAGHDDRVEVVGRDVPGRDVAGCLEGMLPPDSLAARDADYGHVRGLLAEAHERHPELEVLETLRQEHRDLATRQPTSVRHDGLTSAIRDYRSGASRWDGVSRGTPLTRRSVSGSPPPLRTAPLRSSLEGQGSASRHRWLATRGRSSPSPPQPGGG